MSAESRNLSSDPPSYDTAELVEERSKEKKKKKKDKDKERKEGRNGGRGKKGGGASGGEGRRGRWLEAPEPGQTAILEIL